MTQVSYLDFLKFFSKNSMSESTRVQGKVITGDEEVKKEHVQEFVMHLHFC